MKLFAFLLSMFFLVITVVPCAASAGFSGEKLCASEAVHLEESNGGHADFCTPFCVCSCCGISINSAQFKKLIPEKSFFIVKADITESVYEYRILFIAGIWQPPKLS